MDLGDGKTRDKGKFGTYPSGNCIYQTDNAKTIPYDTNLCIDI
jgi:hypothetical protein